MRFFHFAGWTVCAAVAAGCAVPGVPGPSEREQTVDLPPLLAAWLVAEAIRVEHGGADPLPMHAGAPVLKLAEDRFVVRYDRLDGNGLRLHQDGRLLGPAPPRMGSADDEPVSQHFRGVRYQSAGIRTGALQSARAGVTASIAGTPGGGSHVVVQWRGDFRAEPTWRHATRLLDLATVVRDTGILLELGRYAETDHASEMAIDRFASGCCADHRPLAARLWMHRAMAQRRMQHLDAALTSAEVARSWDPSLPGLDLWVAELAERLGRDEQAEAAWLRFELRAPDRGARLAAARSRRRVQLRRTSDAPAAMFVADARRRLEEGDQESAGYLLERARMIEPYDPEGLSLLRRVCEAREDTRRVLEIALLQSAGGELDAQLAARLFRSWNEAGEPGHALRFLARNWGALVQQDASNARAMLQEQVERLGREHACRILASEHAHGLLPSQLAAWSREGGRDRASWSSLSHLLERRSKAVSRGMEAQPPRPGK